MKKRILSMLLVIVLVLSVLPVQVLAAGELEITSSKGSAVIGVDTLTLSAENSDKTPITEKLKWSADEDSVVLTPSEDMSTCKLEGKKQGKVTVTVETEDGSKSGSKELTIYLKPEDLQIIDANTTEAPVTSLKVGDTLNLGYTCTNLDGIVGKSVVWESNNSAAVTIDSKTGVCNAVGTGDATITLKFNGGRAEQKFTVSNQTGTINGKSELTVGRTQTLTLTFDGGQTVPSPIGWNFVPDEGSSADVTLTPNGTTCGVYAKKAGTGKIYAAWDGQTVSSDLEITEVVQLSITGDGVDDNKLNLSGRQTVQLTADVPAGENPADIEWTVTSADNAITETHSGATMTVTGNKVGTATITAKIKSDNATQAANLEITVDGKSRITNPVDTLFVGDTHTCVLETELLDETTFTWKSSNPAAATVDKGVISTVAAGNPTISVKNGETVLDSFTVEVKAESRIELDPSMPTELLCGKDMTLSAVLKDAEGKEVEDAVIKWELVTPKADDTVTLYGNKLTALPDLKNPYDVEINAYVEKDGVRIAETSCAIKVIPTAHQVQLTLNGENINGKTIKLNVNDPADAAGIEVIAKINPATADQGVFWSLKGDSTICTYDPNDFQEGTPAVPASVVVQPIGADKTGTITVTAAARTNEDIKAQFTVEFTKLPTTLEILDLKAEPEENPLRGGNNLTLHTNLEKDNTLTNRRVEWEVTGVAGATIEDGVLNTPVVTAKTKIYVTATAEANSNVKDTKCITLYPSVRSITVTKEGGTSLPAKFNFSDGPIKLQMVATPSDNMGKFEWTSSDKDVATVDKDGLVTFKDAGTVRITCAALDGSNVKTHVNLTIEKKAGYVEVEGVTELVSGKSAAMTATVYVDETKAQKAANQDVIWSVVDENGKATTAASINSKGRLGAKTVTHGVKVYVTARSVENGIESEAVPVIIKPKKAKNFLVAMDPDDTIVGSSLKMNIGVKTTIFGKWYTSADDNYEDEYDCTYFTSNSSVASIDSNGTLKTKKAGTTKITVRAVDEATDNVYTTKFTLKVANLVGYVKINTAEKPKTLNSGKSTSLSATTWVDPTMTKKADNKGVTWKVYQMNDDGEYVTAEAASVSSSGRVTAKTVNKNVKVWVVAISKENADYYDWYEMTIRPKNNYTLRVFYQDGTKERTGTWNVKLGSDELDNVLAKAYDAKKGKDETPDVTWTSGNTKVIKVSGDKLVMTGKTGNAKVTAKVTVGKTTYSASMTLNVVKPVTKLDVKSKTGALEMYSGKTLLMVAKVNSDATNKSVKWSITDGEAYASIDAATGLIRAKKGMTTVREITVQAKATDGSGMTQTAKVRVFPLATKVTIECDGKPVPTMKLTKGANETLEYVPSPDQANKKAVKWSSSRSSVVKVDAKTGEITALKKGTATIKAKATDGSGKYATVKITVVNP